MKSYYYACHMQTSVKTQLKRINSITTQIEALYHSAALKLDISDSAMIILYFIYEGDGEALLSDIYKSSGICKQTINSSIRNLEKNEIIYLVHIDGRSKKVKLTEKGKSYCEQTAGQLSKVEGDVLSSWSAEEVDEFVSLLEKYKEGLAFKVETLSCGDL